jgi:hypothetical protein
VFDSHEKDLLEAAIQDCRVQILEKFNGLDNFDSAEHLSHKIFQIRSDENFSFAGLDFVSTWVRDRVIMLACRRERSNIMQFVRSTAGVGPLGTIRGSAFEGLCHKILRSGQRFEGRELGRGVLKPKKLSLPFPCVEEKIFRDFADIHGAADGEYLRPISKGLKAVDALQKPNNLFQMTVGSKHPVHASGLVEAINALGSQGQVNLFFVLPNDLFEEFEEQAYFRPNPGDETPTQKEARLQKYALEDAVLSRVRQFAVLVDCSVLTRIRSNQAGQGTYQARRARQAKQR